MSVRGQEGEVVMRNRGCVCVCVCVCVYMCVFTCVFVGGRECVV
jgi:hypothetical protein